MNAVFDELARGDGASHPSFACRSLVYIVRLLIEQSPCYMEAKERLDNQPTKQLGKKR